jgi:enoyl-CoA hydratase/carnithine racemase
LSVSRKGGVVTLELAAADTRLSAELHAALEEAAAEIDLDDEVRVVVLCGRGRAFCCGGEPGGRADGIAAVAALRVPVLALLHGAVLDEGLELALACDLRIAAEGTRLGLTQLSRGELPSHGGTQRLPRMVGPAVAARMVLLGEVLTARRAQASGLVAEVVARNLLRRRGGLRARELAARGPAAQRLAKEALRSAGDLPLAEGLRLEGDLYVLLQSTKDRDEGLASFRAKRQPRYQGR